MDGWVWIHEIFVLNRSAHSLHTYILVYIFASGVGGGVGWVVTVENGGLAATARWMHQASISRTRHSMNECVSFTQQ